jgi:hypothetical protein
MDFWRARFSDRSFRRDQNLSASLAMHDGGDGMERRHFLKLAFGFAAGAAALAASAQAAPLAPRPLADDGRLPPSNEEAHPALTTGKEVEHLKPEEVRWGHHWHGRHWGWRHRHWGWRRRHWGWRRRHWGWHRRRWHRRYWRRRYW